MIRLTVWFICIVALLFNSLVLVVTFSRRGDSISTTTASSVSSSVSVISLPPRPLTSARLLVGLLAAANLLTGVYAAALVATDAWAWGDFARVGVWWEGSAACAGLGALAVFSAEWAVLLLALAAVERSLAVRALLGKDVGIVGGGGGPGGHHRGIRGGSSGGGAAGMRRRFAWAAALLALLAAGAGLLTLLPGNGGGDSGEGSVGDGVMMSSSPGSMAASPLCLPFSGASERDGRWLGVAVALTLLNALAYLLTAGVYTHLYCGLGRAHLGDPEQAAAVRHVAWLIFTNCLFFCPVAAFSFSPLLAATAGNAAAGSAAGAGTPDIAKSVLLIFFPLPACLNPVLYAFFSPAFRDDWLRLRGRRDGRSSSVATTTGGCCGGAAARGGGGGGGGGSKWVSTATGVVGGLAVGGVGCQDRVAEDEEDEEDDASRSGRGYGCGYRQLGMGAGVPTVACQRCCQVALLARNSSSSASPSSSSSSSSSSSASGCRHLVKSHSCPALTPGHTPSGHSHHHHHHHHLHHAPHGLPPRPEALWDSGTPSAQSEYADEGDSLVSDSSEQVQACGRACFCHSRGLPLVHYSYNSPRGKD